MKRPANKIWRFHGGLKLAPHKQESNSNPIRQATLPETLILPLRQHIGESAIPRVEVGDQVLKGQLIAQCETRISACVHAPSSGTVVAIEARPVAHPSGLPDHCIVIACDGEDRCGQIRPTLDQWQDRAPYEIRQRVRECGIVGLGGAAFPTAVKLDPEFVNTLLINGAECEPWISCDEMLMREHADQIVKGSQIMRHALQAEQVMIGIEDNKPEAIQAMRSAIKRAEDGSIRLRTIPARYPAGGERQLIHALTGREVPSGGIPADIGFLCHNVGTAAAVFDAVMRGLPMISRLVTVTGAVRNPGVFDVLFGTPISSLISQAGGYKSDVERLVLGGPMMGFALSNDELPITKSANCVLALTAVMAANQNTEQPCIRCGACVDVCPAQLLPQQLFWHARAGELEKARALHLLDCIECGACATVCPSHISLVDYYRAGKSGLREQDSEHAKSDNARSRHEQRLHRIERDAEERAARMAKKKQASESDSQSSIDPKKAAIAAALARSKTRKADSVAGTKTKDSA